VRSPAAVQPLARPPAWDPGATPLCTFAADPAAAAARTAIAINPQNKVDLGNAGIAAVVGAIVARVAMGNFVDVYGPRFGISICIGLTSPAVYCIGMSTTATGFILSRLFIGFSLATFVACQFWCTRCGAKGRPDGRAMGCAQGGLVCDLERPQPRTGRLVLLPDPGAVARGSWLCGGCNVVVAARGVTGCTAERLLERAAT
jgi:hypothetical protein